MIKRILGRHHYAVPFGCGWAIRTITTDIGVDIALSHSEACSTILLLDRMVDGLNACLDAIGA
jgi:hypothetical protein